MDLIFSVFIVVSYSAENELKQEMQEAAAKLDFERAAELRDKLAALSSK